MSGCGGHAEYTVRAHATRIDLEFIPGDPIDLLVPVLDDNDDPVTITEDVAPLWSARSVVRRHWAATRVLHEWSTQDGSAEVVPGTPGQVRLLASSAVTAAWQTGWPELAAHWDLEVVPPGVEPQTIASGRVVLKPQYTS